MSTNSSISIKIKDKYQSQYCHWDGYITGVGRYLFENYNTKEKVEELLSYGDLSSISDTINSCVFYHRDKNEALNIGTLEDLPYNSQEFDYVYEDENWFIMKYWRYDDVTDEEYSYGNYKLIDALILEDEDYYNYKQELRKKKFDIINKK